MTVLEAATDIWIAHLTFLGSRPSLYGNVDGIWYGHLTTLGNVSGGDVILRGLVSFDRKEDWVYILGGYSAISGNVAGPTVKIIFSTGPLIPSQGLISTPSFEQGGVPGAYAGLLPTLSSVRPDGGAQAYLGLPIFGDKKIVGSLSLIETSWDTNTNGVLYELAAWGFLVKYNSFFREPIRAGSRLIDPRFRF